MAASEELQKLIIALGGDASEYNKIMEGAVKEAQDAAKQIAEAASIAERTANKALQEAAQVTAAVATPMERFREQVNSLRGQLSAGAITQETYNRAIRASRNELPAVQAAQAAYNAQVQRASAIYTQVETAAERYRREQADLNTMQQRGLISTETYTRAIQNLARECNVVQAQVQRVAASVTNVGRQMQNAGQMMSMYLTAPITAFGAFSVHEFGKFDLAMTKSFSIMGGLTPQLKKEMEGAAKAISGMSAFAPNQVADAFYFLASTGLDAKQSIGSLPAVERFATAGAFDLARATEMLSDSQSALGLRDKDAVKNKENLIRVSDVLVKAAAASNAEVEQFAKSLTTKSATAMRQLNIEIEDGVAVLAAYADQGIKGEMAGEKYDIMLRELQNAVERHGGAWKQAGINIYDTNKKFIGVSPVIRQLTEHMAKMNDEQKAATFNMLGFRSESKAAVAALFGMSDKIDDYTKQLHAAGGTTKQVADEQMTAFSNQCTQTWNQIKTLAIGIGELLVPTLTWLNGMIRDGVKYWEELGTPTKRFILLMAEIAAVVGPVLVFLGTMTVAAGALAASIAALLTPAILGAIAATVAWVVAAAPFLAIAAVVTAAVAGMTFAIIGKQGAIEAWQGLKNTMMEIVGIDPLEDLKKPVDVGRKSTEELNKEASKTKDVLAAQADAVHDVGGATSKLDLKVQALTEKLQNQLETMGAGSHQMEIFQLKQKGATEAQLQGARDATAAIKEADLTKHIKDTTDQLQHQVETFGMGAKEMEIYKLQQKGATEEQLASARAASAQLKGLEEKKKADEKALHIMEKYKSPAEKYAKTQKELQGFLDEGKISIEAFNYELAEAQKEMNKDMKVEFKVSGVDAVEAGTAEAAAQLNAYMTLRGEVKKPVELATAQRQIPAGYSVMAPPERENAAGIQAFDDAKKQAAFQADQTRLSGEWQTAARFQGPATKDPANEWDIAPRKGADYSNLAHRDTHEEKKGEDYLKQIADNTKKGGLGEKQSSVTLEPANL